MGRNHRLRRFHRLKERYLLTARSWVRSSVPDNAYENGKRKPASLLLLSVKIC
jgi:hypothetical protein